MRITVLLFAAIADATGVRETSIDLPEPGTTDDLLSALAAAHPSFAPWRDRVACAIGERYVPLGTPLADGVTVAIIPPVSGG